MKHWKRGNGRLEDTIEEAYRENRKLICEKDNVEKDHAILKVDFG